MKDPTHGLFKIPTAEERRIARAGAPVNPIKLAAMLTPMQGLLFFSGSGTGVEGETTIA